MGDVVMGRELESGSFRRQRSAFRDWVGVDPRTGRRSEYEVVPGRYRLYVSLACPWCHRTAILHSLAGLSEAIGVSYVAPYRDERGWAFDGESFDDGPGGRYVDPLNGWSFMSEAYERTDPAFDGRVTVPVLWDTERDRIVNNESSDIVRMFASGDSLGALATNPLDLRPAGLRDEIDAVNERVYDSVNNGVYKAGFARSQEAYEHAFGELFDSLAWLEDLLSRRRYVAGDVVTEADWRLFPTLMRFDEVYHVHFRCNYRRIVEYQSLWGYTRELYQWRGVAETVAMDQIKTHYYTTHSELNPKRIVPLGPKPDWLEPHGRG